VREGLNQSKISITPTRIELATFRLVAQCLPPTAPPRRFGLSSKSSVKSKSEEALPLGAEGRGGGGGKGRKINGFEKKKKKRMARPGGSL